MFKIVSHYRQVVESQTNAFKDAVQKLARLYLRKGRGPRCRMASGHPEG